MQLIALAIAPGIAISLFIFHRDAYNREPKLNLIVSFILGVMVVFPIAWAEQYFSASFDKSVAGIALSAFLGVALIEELGKFLVLRLYAYRRKSFDEPLDGIVYSVMVSMGFATLENWLYVKQFGIQVGFMRMFLAVPAHATFAILMGFYTGKAKFEPRNRLGFLLKGLFWAVLFHGLYDFFLFMQQSPDLKVFGNVETISLLLFLGALASFVIAIRLSLLHIRQHRLLSQKTFNPTETMTLRKAYPGDIPLIRKMAEEVWPVTYGNILSPTQLDYMMKLIYSEKSLQDQMEKGQEFIVTYDGVEPIGFASIGLIEPKAYKLHKIYVLPSQQGKGTGKFIIDQLSKAIISKGGHSLRLNVNRFNNAKLFYEKMGFKVISEEDIDIGEGFFMNDYVMEKKL